MKHLNLGCGNRIIPGALNHDIVRHRKEIGVICDLNDTPWPWQDSEFDKVTAVSVFEHLKLNLIETLNECWRIIKPGGELHIKFPLRTSPTLFDDPTHRWQWSMAVLDFVVPTTRYGKKCGFYTPYKWELVTRKTDKHKRNCYAVLRPIK